MSVRAESAQRWADIHVEQLPNGYWRGRVMIKIPQLPAPDFHQNDLFHDAGEALDWARGMIELVTSSWAYRRD